MTKETIKRLDDLYAIDTSGLGTEKATGAAYVIELDDEMAVGDAKKDGTFMKFTDGIQYLASLKERVGLWIPKYIKDLEYIKQYVDPYKKQIMYETY